MKKLLTILAFVAVFAVKADPVEAKSFDSLTESVELFSAEVPDAVLKSFEIKSDKVVFTYSLTLIEPVITGAEAEVNDVGKQVISGMELHNYDLTASSNWHYFSITSFTKSGYRKTEKGYLLKHVDPDSPYRHLKYSSGFTTFGTAST